jgi:hypothetical protein
MEMPRNREAVAPTAPRFHKGGPGGVKGERAYGRSKLSNLIGRLPDVDKRSAVGRRFHDIVSALTIDAGGRDLPEARTQLIRRFAAASVVAEMMEAKLAAGEEINITEHCQLCSTLVRISQRIGVDRIPKNIDEIDADDPAIRLYNERLNEYTRKDEIAENEP